MAKFDLSVILRFIDKSAQGLKGFHANMGKVGKKMQSVGRTMSMAVTAPLIALGVNAIRMGAKYQDTMNMVGAVTNTTGKEFEKLKNLSQKLGATTRFSAVEAGEAMKFMGMAGFDANKIIAATPKVLQLAAAAQLDMGTAADIVTNIMSGYGAKAKDLSKINDVLVSTFTNANVSLPQLGEALKNVGSIASINNIPIEQMAAVLGVLGNAGVQGAEAGTAMKVLMTKLAKPTKEATKQMRFLELELFNTDGSIKDIIGVMKEFENAQRKGATSTQMQTAAYTIFGNRAGPRLVTLLGQGSKAVEDLTKKNKENLGITKRLEERMKLGLGGALDKLGSAWKGLNLAFTEGKFGKVVEGLVRDLADLMSGIGLFVQTHPEITKWGLALAGVTAIVGPLLIGLGLAAIAIGAITLPMVAVAAAVLGITVGVAKLMQLAGQKKRAQTTNIAKATEGGLGGFRQAEAANTEMLRKNPNFISENMGIAAGLGAFGTGMNTEITVKVLAEKDTSALVTNVNGNGKVNVENEAYVGPIFAFGA